MPPDVRPDHLAVVRAILRRHVPNREVWAFGSRVEDSASKTSDLDLCVIGETPLSYETSARLRHDFSESDIPYSVDALDWATTSESFREIIRRDKVVVHEARVVKNSAAQARTLDEAIARNFKELGIDGRHTGFRSAALTISKRG